MSLSGHLPNHLSLVVDVETKGLFPMRLSVDLLSVLERNPRATDQALAFRRRNGRFFARIIWHERLLVY